MSSLLAALAALSASENPLLGLDTALTSSPALPKATWRFYAPLNTGRVVFPNGQSLAALNGVLYTNDPYQHNQLRSMGCEEIKDVNPSE